MNVDNRRLREIQREKMHYHELLNNAESISDCITFKGRIDVLEEEEKEILARYDVVV